MKINRIKPFYKKRLNYYFGWQKSFQGFGLMFSLDNPLIMDTRYFLIEFKFLYFTFWITLQPNKKHWDYFTQWYILSFLIGIIVGMVLMLAFIKS